MTSDWRLAIRPVLRSLRVAVMAAALLTCAKASPPPGFPAPAGLLHLYESKEFFQLRAALDTAATDAPAVVFLRAAVAHAFNDAAGSNAYLDELRTGLMEVPGELRAEAARLRFRNHVRLGEYRDAVEAASVLAAMPWADSATRADVANEARAMAALVDVPPQRVRARAPTEIRLDADGRIPVTIMDSARAYILDTGANLSVLARSEAEALRLPVRAAGVEVGGSTGFTVVADVAVAPRVSLGGLELEHVVFLVLPDEVLTFSPDFRITGIIGFPVIDAMGEVEFRQGGVIRVPGKVPDRALQNLALSYLTPLIEIRVLGDTAVCDFDTGANRTSLHLPLLERHRARIEREGRADTIQLGGAGEMRRMPIYVLSDTPVELGGTVVQVPELPVYTESVAAPGEVGLACRLGLDVLAGFQGYLLNLRSMSFIPF